MSGYGTDRSRRGHSPISPHPTLWLDLEADLRSDEKAVANLIPRLPASIPSYGCRIEKNVSGEVAPLPIPRSRQAQPRPRWLPARSATRPPSLAAWTAKAAAIEDLPKPPFVEATAIVMGVCFMASASFILLRESIFLDLPLVLHAFFEKDP